MTDLGARVALDRHVMAGAVIPPPGVAPGNSVRGHAVSLSGVDVDRGGVPVLRSVDAVVPRGSVVGVTGRNGSGKSTLLNVLATLLHPLRGVVSILGVDLGVDAGVPAALRARIGYVAHQPALHPARTIHEELATVAALRGRHVSDVGRALDRVGLTGAADHRVAHCSQGMRRRADLARVALGEPDLLLLDEADAGLDQDATAVVDGLVADVRTRGGAVLAVGHDRDRLAATCDVVWSLRGGCLEVAP